MAKGTDEPMVADASWGADSLLPIELPIEVSDAVEPVTIEFEPVTVEPDRTAVVDIAKVVEIVHGQSVIVTVSPAVAVYVPPFVVSVVWLGTIVINDDTTFCEVDSVGALADIDTKFEGLDSLELAGLAELISVV